MKARIDEPGTLGIIAGAGALPLDIARRARAAGREVFVLGFRDLAEPGIAEFPHDWLRWGQLGRMLRLLRRAGCRDVVIIGGARRPRLWSLRVDAGLIRHAPMIYQLTRGGDDAVLSRIVRFFEAQGFHVRGAHEIAADLTAPAGVMTCAAPKPIHLGDVEKALAILQALGPHDVGQAAVVARGYALAIEAAEGTDAMLRRCAGLRQWGLSHRHGVLVKVPKPGQELRVDMPTIGPRTVELAAEAGLAGIAVARARVLLAEPEEMVARADRLGLFITGIDAERPASASAVSQPDHATSDESA